MRAFKFAVILTVLLALVGCESSASLPKSVISYKNSKVEMYQEELKVSQVSALDFYADLVEDVLSAKPSDARYANFVDFVNETYLSFIESSLVDNDEDGNADKVETPTLAEFVSMYMTKALYLDTTSLSSELVVSLKTTGGKSMFISAVLKKGVIISVEEIISLP